MAVRPVLRLVLCVSIAAPLSGCTINRAVSSGPEVVAGKWDPSPRGRQIVGYTTSDGVYHRFRGWIRSAGQDSLVLELDPESNDADPQRQTLALERSQVVSVRETSRPWTAALMAGAAAAAVGAYVLLTRPDGSEEPIAW